MRLANGSHSLCMHACSDQQPEAMATSTAMWIFSSFTLPCQTIPNFRAAHPYSNPLLLLYSLLCPPVLPV